MSHLCNDSNLAIMSSLESESKLDIDVILKSVHQGLCKISTDFKRFDVLARLPRVLLKFGTNFD